MPFHDTRKRKTKARSKDFVSIYKSINLHKKVTKKKFGYQKIWTLLFFFLTLDNYIITVMKNNTDDSTTDNSTCRMRIHAWMNHLNHIVLSLHLFVRIHFWLHNIRITLIYKWAITLKFIRNKFIYKWAITLKFIWNKFTAQLIKITVN